MSKELEALERLTYFSDYDKSDDDHDLVFKALHRLEAIDNANPSKALECLEKLKGMEISSMPFSDEYGTQEVDLNDIRKVGSQLNTDFREYTTTIKQALLKAEKEHNSVNLLMQELDCKDFAELRKYARCGYEKLNNFKGSKEVKIEIPESSLMDYNPVKHYLKWEDLEFDTEWKYQEVKLNGTKYTIKYKCGFDFFDNYYEDIKIYNQNKRKKLFELYNNEQFFNDLRLERVEE